MLAISDVPLAVEQFLMLCQAGMMTEFYFGLRGVPTEQEIDSVAAAVSTFLAAYATKNCNS